MIKFEHTEVFNFEGALRGMRNPLNSWKKNDSYYGCEYSGCMNCPQSFTCNMFANEFIVGENDLKLAQNLIKAGPDHRKFMRQIIVSVDITAPLYWWKEFDTYKVGTVSNSCSTMHKIHAKEFTLNDFSCEHLFNDGDRKFLKDFEYTVHALNMARTQYIETKDKRYWWQMIQLLPSSYNQKRTITFNYENILNIYHSRKNHKLDEWSIGFMEWIDTLPYANELIKGGD